MNNKEKVAISNIYERIQRIAGISQTYKITRAFDGVVTDEIQALENETAGIFAEIDVLKEENERRKGGAR